LSQRTLLPSEPDVPGLRHDTPLPGLKVPQGIAVPPPTTIAVEDGELGEGSDDERTTLPPPLPVSEYVQTMMQQAVDEEWDELMPPSRPAPAWRNAPTVRLSSAPPGPQNSAPTVQMPSVSRSSRREAPTVQMRSPLPEPGAPPAVEKRPPLDTLQDFHDLPSDFGASSGGPAIDEPFESLEEVTLDRPTLPQQPELDPLEDMRQRMAARDYSGALVVAESILASEPESEQARRCAEDCRERLADKYIERLGGRCSVPRVVMRPDELHKLSLDHRAGFLLSFIDGTMSIEEVLDVASMPMLDALRIVYELREQGVIDIDVGG